MGEIEQFFGDEADKRQREENKNAPEEVKQPEGRGNKSKEDQAPTIKLTEEQLLADTDVKKISEIKKELESFRESSQAHICILFYHFFSDLVANRDNFRQIEEENKELELKVHSSLAALDSASTKMQHEELLATRNASFYDINRKEMLLAFRKQTLKVRESNLAELDKLEKEREVKLEENKKAISSTKKVQEKIEKELDNLTIAFSDLQAIMDGKYELTEEDKNEMKDVQTYIMSLEEKFRPFEAKTQLDVAQILELFKVFGVEDPSWIITEIEQFTGPEVTPLFSELI